MPRCTIVAVLALACLAACAQQTPVTREQLIERGDYLVNDVVLCGDCHTPRAGAGAADSPPDLSRRLHGALVAAPPPLANFAPALAGGPTNYSDEQFLVFLQTGVRPDGSQPRPPMPPYRLNEDDARAVAAYISSLPRAPE